MTSFVYFECPECEWNCVLTKRESELGLTCPLCAGDNGRDVYLHSRDAAEDDRPEGVDARREAAKSEAP